MGPVPLASASDRTTQFFPRLRWLAWLMSVGLFSWIYTSVGHESSPRTSWKGYLSISCLQQKESPQKAELTTANRLFVPRSNFSHGIAGSGCRVDTKSCSDGALPWQTSPGPRSLKDAGPEGHTGSWGSGDCCTIPSHLILPLLAGCEGLSQAGGSGSGWQRQAVSPPPAEILGTRSFLMGTSWGLAPWGRWGLRDPPCGCSRL